MSPLEPDITQDPDVTVNEGGIFYGRTFIFYGFPEYIPVSSYIKENGGTVLKTNARVEPDYTVVPIDGFPVDRPIGDIVTTTWLQICIEQSKLLDVQKNPLFTPIELNVESSPLSDCVLSISGYIGAERDSLVQIADVLGAKIRHVHMAMHNLFPYTHIVVNAPAGSKYTAAKKWGIPAVSKLWLLACASSGKRESEERFLIDSITNDNVLDISSLVDKPGTDISASVQSRNKVSKLEQKITKYESEIQELQTENNEYLQISSLIKNLSSRKLDSSGSANTTYSE